MSVYAEESLYSNCPADQCSATLTESGIYRDILSSRINIYRISIGSCITN